MLNAYNWPAHVYVKKGEFQNRYVKAWGAYIRLVKFKLTGVCRDNPFLECKQEIVCFGNRVLKTHNIFEGYSNEIDDFSENTLESIAYYPLEYYETEEEMREAYSHSEDEFFSSDELNYLFRDIVGEAG